MKAADALAKRQIDAVAIAERGKDNAFTINLRWDRDNSEENPNLPETEELPEDPMDNEEDINAEQ